MRLLAIDPGTHVSAYVLVEFVPTIRDSILVDKRIVDNGVMLHVLGETQADELAIEKIESYGMPVGAEVFETVFWSGRFVERWTRSRGVLHEPQRWRYVTRRAVKLGLCGSPRANDASVRTALLDLFGPGKTIACGTKRSPGPLYGVSNDLWSALAVAVTHYRGQRANDAVGLPNANRGKQD